MQAMAQVATTLLFLGLACSTLQLSQANPFRPEDGPFGVSPRDAWPEQLFRTHHEVAFAIRDPFQHNCPVDFHVFVQGPYHEDNRQAPNYDDEQDVWLYTTGIDAVVYELPRRGRWHPNRIDPGWPHLKGVHYKQAIATIKRDMPSVLVEYQPVGFPSSDDLRINRVLLYVDDDEKVANIPKVG